ncbi:MAG: 4-alpha-glucanotransferase, partial [Clostridia bacterium]|nr:4-alpha-glucanotransferase [Clostridia bacterium]
MRTSGVLMHISSLPSRYGIGTLGQSAYDFVDFLEKAGQTYWQILPLGPTGYGDSPYASSSTFAGNPYFIDLETLVRDGLVSPKDLHDEDFGDDITRVDYGKLYQNRGKVLRKAVRKMLERKDPLDMAGLDAFEKENGWWLDGFSLFSALKDRFLGLPWSNWPKEYRDAASPETARAKEELSGEIAYHRTVQYLFYRQWDRLKKYANDKGIRIIGDLPIYVALDSVDVWSSPENFQLD